MSLLQVFDNQLDKIVLQKLLFLLSKQQEKSSYHFVPYKLGCFSFQANADLITLSKYKLVYSSQISWKKIDNRDYLSELSAKDQASLKHVKFHFGSLSREDLIKYTYKNFPFYAINSKIADDVLSSDEYKSVRAQKPAHNENILFTIGYEGISIEQYINKLILNDIKVLCDVRKKSFSMKYGFSKSQLKHACESVGIDYMHFPELGIDSDKRQHLNDQKDYDNLFLFYRSVTLEKETVRKEELLSVLNTNKRIALTCFEANVNQCHRKPLAESISCMRGFSAELKHI